LRAFQEAVQVWDEALIQGMVENILAQAIDIDDHQPRGETMGNE
jgi:hypothetical protein